LDTPSYIPVNLDLKASTQLQEIRKSASITH